MLIRLPTMSGNVESTVGTVMLRTITTPIPPGIPIPDGLPKLIRVPGKNDTRVREDEVCPVCRGIKFVSDRGEVVRCPCCKGGGVAPAVVHVAVIEDADVLGMPKTSEVIKAFVGIDGVRIDGMLMLKANAGGVDPTDRDRGTARIWVTTDGKAFPPPRVIDPYGPVFEAKKAAMLYLNRTVEGGTGYVEFLAAVQGKAWREKLVDFVYHVDVDEVETSGAFGGYASEQARTLCEDPSWNIRLGAIFQKALPLAIQKSRESRESDPVERLSRKWGKERPQERRRERDEKPQSPREAAAVEPAPVEQAQQKCSICDELSDTVRPRPIDGKDELMCDKCWKDLGEASPVSTKCCNCDAEGTGREVADRKMVMCDKCWEAANGGGQSEPEKPAKKRPRRKTQAQE